MRSHFVLLNHSEGPFPRIDIVRGLWMIASCLHLHHQNDAEWEVGHADSDQQQEVGAELPPTKDRSDKDFWKGKWHEERKQDWNHSCLKSCGRLWRRAILPM